MLMLTTERLLESIQADGAQCAQIFSNGTAKVITQSGVHSFSSLADLEDRYGQISNQLKARFDVICQATAEVYDVKLEDILSLRRYEPIATAKHIARYLCDQVCDRPLRYLSDYFQVDRGSISNSVRAAQSLLETYVDERCRLERIKTKAGL